MKYAFLILFIIIALIIFMLIYLKKTTNKAKETPAKEISKINVNPSFEITLIDNKKAQLNIYKSSVSLK